MTASVRYWRLPEEEQRFIAYLDSIEPTVAFQPHTEARMEDIKWKPLAEAFAADKGTYLITPARFVPLARSVWVESPLGTGFTVSVTESPALFYYRGRMIAPNCLSTSSLSADWSFLAADQRTMVDFPAEYVRWAKRVMQWVRKEAPGWHQYKAHRITPKAEAARLAGLELD